MNIKLKPVSEINFILDCLENSNLIDSTLGDVFLDVFDQATEGWELHESITDDVIYDFTPLFNFVEEEIYIELSNEELWTLHSAFQGYLSVYPDCTHANRVWRKLTTAVSQLEVPPY